MMTTFVENDKGQFEPAPEGPDPITNGEARLVWDAPDQTEPLPGSVVLIGGPWGTAYQRWFLDGLWHSTRDKGGPKPWSWLLQRRNVVLAYDAEERPAEYEYSAGNPRPETSHLTGEDAEAML